MKKAFTLVELLVVIVTIVVLGSLMMGMIGGCATGPTGQSYQKTDRVDTFTCVKTYTVASGESSTSKRVDLRPIDGGGVVTMTCDDNWRAGISNSATLYAQFQPDRVYKVNYIGFRKEGYFGYFPLIKSLVEVEK